ncbi:glycosyltransferase family 2 protein [Paucibacter sp. B51]|uniref:glycosyltransferase family 2 protein n=1 Tax=Paucibacter sp. B51 TaxID=2993315 RepID=UPI0022EBCF6F|nr:glycosyltransferase [Paucibacter sp. B51]
MPNSQPKWSVIIPLFNKEAFVSATLQSVLLQAGDNCEIVVVDDGSSDGGAQRIESLRDPRVRLIRQANAGVAAARNRGIREAAGQWLVFLDADDLLHPQALECYAQLEAEYPGSKMLAGITVRVPDDQVATYQFSRREGALKSRRIDNLAAEFLRVGMPFSSSSVAVRRDFLQAQAVCFPVGESMGEDLDLWFRLVEQQPVAYAEQILALYRTALASSLMGSFRGLDLLPVWHRLRARALAGSMSQVQAKDSLRVVAEMEVTLARRLMRAAQFGPAWARLRDGRVAMRGRRWWLTFAVWLTGSAALAQRLR